MKKLYRFEMCRWQRGHWTESWNCVSSCEAVVTYCMVQQEDTIYICSINKARCSTLKTHCTTPSICNIRLPKVIQSFHCNGTAFVFTTQCFMVWNIMGLSPWVLNWPWWKLCHFVSIQFSRVVSLSAEMLLCCCGSDGIILLGFHGSWTGAHCYHWML